MNTITVRNDLRGRFGPARDQEGRETCLAFASSDAHAAAIGGSWSPLSCESLFYQAKQRDKTSAHHGTTVPAIRAALEHDGQPAESGWPYLGQLPADLTRWKPPAEVSTLFRRGSGHIRKRRGQWAACVDCTGKRAIQLEVNTYRS